MRSIREDVENLERFEEIIGILFSEGCGYILDHLDLTEHLPIHKKLRAERHKKPGPERVRETFEKLGPTFIKFGQMLSERKDLIPGKYADELKKLENDVPGFDPEKAKEMVDQEIGMDKFKDFQDEAIASASIAQVHRAELRNGEEVAVKVRKPGIADQIRHDLKILEYIASKYEKFKKDDHDQILRDVQEFADWTLREINFENEIRNGKRLQEELDDWDRIRIPDIYEEYSTNKVIVLEYMDAVRCDNVEAIKDMDVEFQEIAEIGVKAQLEQIFKHGFFHGDPHPSNFLIDQEGNLVYLDFGIMGKLTREKRKNVLLLIFSLLGEDVDGVIDSITEIGYVRDDAEIQELENEVEKTIKELQGTSIGETSFTRALAKLTLTASEYGVFFPNDLIVMSKGMATMEGIGLELYPEYNFKEENEEFLRELMRSQFNLEEEKGFVLADILRNREFLEKPISSLRSKDEAPKIEIKGNNKSSRNMLIPALVVCSTIFITAGAATQPVLIYAGLVELLAAAYLAKKNSE